MTIQISAIICTYNRATYLRKAIQSLTEQTLDPSSYEILVVDNRSTDDTKKIVTEEFAYIPNLRYLYEPIQGLSQARNTGWQNAKGEYIAYLDDDAIASQKWLKKILEVFETTQPQPGGVGGKVEPIWEVPQPEWLPDKLLGYLTVIDLSETPIILTSKQFFAGANMAFPKYIMEKVGGFSVEIGIRSNKIFLYNDDLLFKKQVEDSGYNCFYSPEIFVKHHVPASRLTQLYFIKRIYWQKVSDAVVHINQESLSRLKRLKIAFSLIFEFCRSPRQIINMMRVTNNQHLFKAKTLSFGKIGYITGLLGVEIAYQVQKLFIPTK